MFGISIALLLVYHFLLASRAEPLPIQSSQPSPAGMVTIKASGVEGAMRRRSTTH